ncbi:MAG: LamG domain-containing protein [Candidatus Schekmanbacteria bacterium]|nr:LamG domain-containing protein [Candidatus Schekmanbacteria bacterium]
MSRSRPLPYCPRPSRARSAATALLTATLVVGALTRTAGAEPSRALNLPFSRSPQDYAILDPAVAPMAALPFSQGGLSPQAADFSLSFWLRFDRKMKTLEPTMWYDDRGNVMTFGNSLWIDFVGKDANRGIHLALEYNTAPAMTTDRLLLPEEWTHVAIVFRRAAKTTATVFFNGRVAMYRESDQPFAITVDRLTLGAGLKRNQPKAGESLGLAVDDLAIHPRALSDLEVSRLLADGPAAIDGAAVAGWWPFQDAAKGPWQDSSATWPLIAPAAPAQSSAAAGSAIRTATYALPDLAFAPREPAVIYQPFTEEQATLLAFLRNELSTPEAFSATVEPMQADALIAALGSIPAHATVSGALLPLSDTIRLADEVFAGAYDPVPDGPDAGTWRFPVDPGDAALMALFYSLEEDWNPYRASAYARAPQLRNRIAAATIPILLSSVASLESDKRAADQAYTAGFPLTAAAYVCSRICADLTAPGVATAWRRTLDRGLRLLWTDTSTTPVGHLLIGSMETDMDLAAVMFVNHLLEVDQALAVPASDVKRHQIVRDEWTHLLVDLRSIAERSQRGETKGFSTGGLCTMDGTAGAQYNKECFDWLAMIYGAALRLPATQENAKYVKRIASVLEKNLGTTLLNLRRDGGWFGTLIAPNAFNGRHNSAASFHALPHFTHWTLIDRLPVSASGIRRTNHGLLYPLAWEDFKRLNLNGLDDGTVAPENTCDLVDAGVAARLPTTLAKANDPVVGHEHSGRNHAFRKPADYRDSWSSLRARLVAEDATHLDVCRDALAHPELAMLPAQSPEWFTLAMGKSGEQDFFAGQNDTLNAVWFAGRTPAANNVYKGWAGSGLASFTVRTSNEESGAGAVPMLATPIQGGYLGNLENTFNVGTCRDENDTRLESTPANWPRCTVITQAGLLDWKHWPVHAVIGAATRDALGGQVDPTTVFSSVHYDLGLRQTRRGPNGSIVLRTESPFYRNHGHLCFTGTGKNLAHCQGGDLPQVDTALACAANAAEVTHGACLSREYALTRDGLHITTAVDRFADQASRQVFGDPAAVVLDTLPVRFAHPGGTAIDDLFFSQIVAFHRADTGWFHIDPADGSAAVTGVDAISIRPEPGVPTGARVTFDAPVTVRFDTLAAAYVAHDQPYAANRYGTRNLLIEIPRDATRGGDGPAFSLRYTLGTDME